MERILKVSRAWIEDNWQVWLVGLAGVAAVGLLVLYKLGSLVHGLSASEYDLQQVIAQHTLGGQAIIRDPVHLPYYVGLYSMQLTPFHGPTAVRFISALFGVLGAIGFFYILRKWYTLRIAILGTALFTTSSWFLHAARFASADADYLLLPLLIGGVIYIQSQARSRVVALLVTILGLLSFYIPGMIWFLIPAIVIERRIIIKALRLQPLWAKIITGLLTATILAPLVIMVAWPKGDRLQNLLSLLGLPGHVPSFLQIAKNLEHLVSNVFIYNYQGPLYVPGHLPLLDVCTGALVLLGLFQFIVHYKLGRTQLIILVGALGTILIASGGPVPIMLLLPFLYLLAVEGLKWLLALWLAIFPRNPFARSFGISLIIVLVLITSFYHLSRYYLAWGHSPETRAVFNKLP